MATGAPNVWAQMNYVPPRGLCNHKASLIAPRCPCLRFMLHPLKSSSSYECDGCGHHASFHSMENQAEDEILKRWELEAKEKAERDEEAQPRPKKRVRAIEYNKEDENTGHTARAFINLARSQSPKPRAGAAPRKTGRAAGARAKSKSGELRDAATYVELD
ncbi:hypothetical protein BDW02DRAFT_530848 [Decorospora gaudefroyi]|uniref:Uncharacterized protein n=1 Tax=Decorospora gaudefroyi TaxID=184978 RepID=A0A6A5KC06_9PLEO|nr:hypothetical protein BDW02DRAFT_530848 [Decorospora gaudefroyi]